MNVLWHVKVLIDTPRIELDFECVSCRVVADGGKVGRAYWVALHIIPSSSFPDSAKHQLNLRRLLC